MVNLHNHKLRITFKNYESLCCTPETYIAHQLYLNLKTLMFQKKYSYHIRKNEKKMSWESGYVEQVKIKIGS